MYRKSYWVPITLARAGAARGRRGRPVVEVRGMSAFRGKADVIQGMAECPLLAISGHWPGQRHRFMTGHGRYVLPKQGLTAQYRDHKIDLIVERGPDELGFGNLSQAELAQP